MEHRQQRRQRAFALAEVKCRNKIIMMGLAYNVTRDGLFILGTFAPKVDKVVEICITIPKKEKLLIPISGIVVHRGNNGFGLMFCEQDEATWQLADKLLRKHEELITIN